MARLLLAVFLVLSGSIALANPLMMQPGEQQRSLGGHLHLLFDPSHSLTIDEVSRQEMQHAFQALPADVNLGYIKDAVWLRFTLAREPGAPREWWLRVEPAYLDVVSLYRPEGEGIYRVQQAGAALPWRVRAIPDRTTIFSVSLESEQAQTYYLRIENSTAIQARLTLWQPATFNLWNVADSLIFGGYLITALVIVLINLFYWYSLRERLFLAYMFYVATLAGFFLVMEGYYLLLLQPETVHPIKSIQALLQASLVWAHYYLFASLVRPEQYLPRFSLWYGRLVTLLCLAGVMFVLLGYISLVVPLLWQLVMVIFIVNLVLAMWLSVKGERVALYYLLAFFVLVMVAILRLFYVFGVVEYSFIVEYGILLGTVFHWVLIQLFVLDILARAKRAHEGARDMALQAAKRAETELEQGVKIRTEELHRSNQRLQEEIAARSRLTRDVERTRQRLEDALEEEQQAQVAQRQFLRVVAHEFRTPLTVIQTSGELLAEDNTENPELRRRTIERFQNAATRMGQLVDRALTLDRFDGSVWRANASWIEVATLLEAVAHYGRGIDYAQHRIEVDSVACQIQGDRELLEICIHNLLDNAIKYSPPGSLIQLKGEVDQQGWVVITVSDQGEGIPEMEQRNIFSKYFRLEGNTAPGLGLGLYLVDYIARLHGGHIGLESRPGQGSCFRVHLPVGNDTD